MQAILKFFKPAHIIAFIDALIEAISRHADESFDRCDELRTRAEELRAEADAEFKAAVRTDKLATNLRATLQG